MFIVVFYEMYISFFVSWCIYCVVMNIDECLGSLFCRVLRTVYYCFCLFFSCCVRHRCVWLFDISCYICCVSFTVDCCFGLLFYLLFKTEVLYECLMFLVLSLVYESFCLFFSCCVRHKCVWVFDVACCICWCFTKCLWEFLSLVLFVM